MYSKHKITKEKRIKKEVDSKVRTNLKEEKVKF